MRLAPLSGSSAHSVLTYEEIVGLLCTDEIRSLPGGGFPYQIEPPLSRFRTTFKPCNYWLSASRR